MVNATINGRAVCVPEGTTIKEAAESVALLKQSMAAAGYRVVTARGDWKGGGQ